MTENLIKIKEYEVKDDGRSFVMTVPNSFVQQHLKQGDKLGFFQRPDSNPGFEINIIKADEEDGK